MHDFRYLKDKLYCEGIAIDALAKKFGTPLYVYSQNTLTDHYQKLDRAMADLDHLICFAVKSNSNISVLRTLARLGSGFDIVSGPLLVERGLANAVGGLVGIAVSKELAPVMMSILIAGRIGSAMAAEIGSMQVYQEIDALRTMNISPVHYLVLPRLIAIAFALPLLVVFAILVGWLGGAFVSFANRRIDISFLAFFTNLKDVVAIKDVANGVFKSFVFALVIAVVSCHQGLITRGGPRGIGRSVTKAVVNSIVLIVILDYILTRVLLK